ncbi:Uncharacterized protein APZ42_023602 [Daphnia magna]|uniref:Uncharacterized protein n=1 Tax=Daphnia magna TaxID=35525 RepID=A0A164UTS2_9CRUS|nr:Uncharacterized protein APZ42_023602 [Daphnia magna]
MTSHAWIQGIIDQSQKIHQIIQLFETFDMATESPRTGLVSLGMSEVHSGRDPTMKPKERDKFEKLAIKYDIFKFHVL